MVIPCGNLQLASRQPPLCEGNIHLVLRQRIGVGIDMLDLDDSFSKKIIVFCAQMLNYPGNNCLHAHSLGGEKSSRRGREHPTQGGWSWGKS